MAHGLRLLDNMVEFIPPQLQEMARNIQVDNTKEDRLIFILTESGEFSTKAYHNDMMAPFHIRRWAKWVWNPILPPNISSFLWKLSRHAIPVDCRVRTQGIQLVSRCRCCKHPQEETLIHLFMKSDMVVEVWRCFGMIYKLPYSFSSILQAMKTWMDISPSPSQFDIGRMATAAHVLHEIWVGRCRATYDDKPMHARQICIRVIRKVQLISLVNLPKCPSSKLQYHQLELVGMTRKYIRQKKEGWFRWESPEPGIFKLNIDGSAQDDVITGGGIVRDASGRVVAGFSANYGDGTNNWAELLALCDGLSMCGRLQLPRVCVESNLAFVVQAIQKRQSENWRFFYVVTECLRSFHPRYTIEHV